MDALREKAGRLPRRPGVYLMKDGQGRVVYVGKAVDLRSRVRSYFSGGGDGRPLIPSLMVEVADLEFVVTGTEKEALILENILIKEHRPRYNVTYRDDKTYVSLRLDPRERFPRIRITRQRPDDGALYFGPYSSKQALQETLKAVRTVFPLRHCTDAFFRRRTRPCLYHEIGQCLAPCVGLVDEKEYGQAVKGAIQYLRGRKGEVVADLEQRMEGASQRLEFEEAARLRDQVAAIRRTLEKQVVVDLRAEDRDIWGWAREGPQLAFQVMRVRGGRLRASASHLFENTGAPADELAASFLHQFYSAEGEEIPGEVVLADELAGPQALAERLGDLRGRKVQLTFPQQGSKARLARLARENAGWAIQAARGRGEGAELARGAAAELGLPAPPARIECFDVSCVMGASATASQVTFADGRPDKSGYRRYRLQGRQLPDDYAMMREVLGRRLRRAAGGEAGWELPDLLLLDGGKGQLGVARKVLDELGLRGPALAAIAKERRSGSPRGEEEGGDRIYVEGRSEPLDLPEGSPALLLCQRLRDEAHRFAVGYHRRLHRRQALHSALDEIPGVGPARRRALLTHFGSLARLQEATAEEIAAVKGVSRALAETIRRQLEKVGPAL